MWGPACRNLARMLGPNSLRSAPCCSGSNCNIAARRSGSQTLRQRKTKNQNFKFCFFEKIKISNFDKRNRKHKRKIRFCVELKPYIGKFWVNFRIDFVDERSAPTPHALTSRSVRSQSEALYTRTSFPRQGKLIRVYGPTCQVSLVGKLTC